MLLPVSAIACPGGTPRRLNKKLLTLSIGAVLSLPTAALAQQSGAIDDPALMEEVIVTGSFIRRSEGFTAASPITQMSAEDLQAEGTVNMAQVVQNLTFNAGTGVTSGIQGVSDQSAGFNLRGLGQRATLQLMDGKRVPSANVQMLLPGIATQRIDIVTDGAAALYGTDAVAGVVNIIPYTSYDGVSMEYYEERDTRGDFHDREISAIWGGDLSNNINAVAALSHRDQGQLRWHDRPEHMNAGLTHNTGSHPGNFIAPLRDENGLLTGAMAGRPDPTCGLIVEEPAQVDANPYGLLFGGRCWLDFGSTRNFRNPGTVSQFYGNVNYDVNADLNISAQLKYARQLRLSRANQANPGGRVTEMPVVRGELPGNTFRAKSSAGRELFARPLMDASGSIVTDGYGRPLPLRGPDGHVMLADNQFASMDADPMGGVPFYEDVFLEAWMPFGKTNTLPSGFNNDRTNPEQLGDYRNYRFALTADFSMPYLNDWDGTAYYTISNDINRSRSGQLFSFSAIEQGLNCDVINDVDHCFNPFGLVDERFATPQHVADAIWPLSRVNNQTKLQTFDFVTNGTIAPNGFELPGGAIGAAIGYQRRIEAVDNVPAVQNIIGDQFIGTQEFPSSHSRFVNAGFVELALPLLSNLELGVAVRHENFSSGQDSTISKVGIVYEPVDWLGLRATYGEAFIVPTLTQLFAAESCGLSQVDDQFSTFSGWITSCAGGNPNLQSETSESISLGIDLLPTDNLRLSLTWSETDFVDRIVSTTTQDTIRTDFFNFQQATGFTPTAAQPNPTLEQLIAWTADPRSDSRIIRNPLNIETVQMILQSDSNASTMLVRAWDMTMDYSRPFRDWGTFHLGMQGTYMETYNFQLSPIDPPREAVGQQNDSFGAVPAMPRIRANARFGWSRDRHSASATVRYVDSVNFDANEFSFQQFFPFNNWRHTDEIRAWTQMDALYTYSDLQMFGGSLSLTGGVRNVFDREAQKTGMIAGVVTQLQDVLGRVVYARINFDF